MVRLMLSSYGLASSAIPLARSSCASAANSSVKVPAEARSCAGCDEGVSESNVSQLEGVVLPWKA